MQAPDQYDLCSDFKHEGPEYVLVLQGVRAKIEVRVVDVRDSDIAKQNLKKLQKKIQIFEVAQQGWL